ncbi:MAG: 50S ribosomal protein L17 [Oscillospiraceae bacterium]|jgi:large subunit ribosomal protein L17|nr:50S ribosomal protein L17 [Oscillospiraceae bacterium]MBR4132411.1 50S ribosomal protein L17 [Oscillospiraceae bacterium]
MPGTRKLGKPTDQRMAMLRQQVTDLMTYGKITTTVTRAKELKPLADKMITLGKRNTLASRRQALAFMTKEDAVTRVFTILAPIYAERNGGYTRVVRLGARRGDAAEEAIIALVDEDKIAAADAEAEKARKEEERAAKKAKKA